MFNKPEFDRIKKEVKSQVKKVKAKLKKRNEDKVRFLEDKYGVKKETVCFWNYSNFLHAPGSPTVGFGTGLDRLRSLDRERRLPLGGVLGKGSIVLITLASYIGIFTVRSFIAGQRDFGN